VGCRRNAGSFRIKNKTYDNDYYPGMAIHEMGTARMGNDPKTSV
jgi:choline dehydrogenase-like flavoprotein